MNAQPRRVENTATDRGVIPQYATGVVEQPWSATAPLITRSGPRCSSASAGCCRAARAARFSMPSTRSA